MCTIEQNSNNIVLDDVRAVKLRWVLMSMPLHESLKIILERTAVDSGR
eukprot:CAMPEP_0184674870 /NCGR_PEP_ID=MMETSP0308-20130426/87479_1 /TAXON_ID=38269 /ORGANISM="Gloeochaete witrockiana, Strain SAG 46.84" /LENGTH=47 /DNA_ID= /DNA_START= /DNA_END= /DNA_ORIENTATION=